MRARGDVQLVPRDTAGGPARASACAAPTMDIERGTRDTRARMVSTVAVGVDASSTAGEAVKLAAELAQRFDARLVLLSAYKDAGGAAASRTGDEELQWAASSSARQRETVARTEERLKRSGVRCSTLVAEGEAADVLVRLAADCAADILVVGNKGIQRRVLGSVPNTVTHKAGCSVLVVKTT
jgi:nucleotide-binding universal stress UspA family protein